MFVKLAWALVAFLVIGVGRTVVEWIGTHVLKLSYETNDSVAGYYVVVATFLLIFVLIKRHLFSRA
ncbi:MAG: hypothetical protein JOZ96_19520 [Acidobacteria bacterium]|nr:hypothetical protein [Acidobacteriota bacterium]